MRPIIKTLMDLKCGKYNEKGNEIHRKYSEGYEEWYDDEKGWIM